MWPTLGKNFPSSKYHQEFSNQSYGYYSVYATKTQFLKKQYYQTLATYTKVVQEAKMPDVSSFVLNFLKFDKQWETKCADVMMNNMNWQLLWILMIQQRKNGMKTEISSGIY